MRNSPERHRNSWKIFVKHGLPHTSIEMHAQKFGCRMREDFLKINLLLVACFLTKNSLFNILLILKSKKLGECALEFSFV